MPKFILSISVFVYLLTPPSLPLSFPVHLKPRPFLLGVHNSGPPPPPPHAMSCFKDMLESFQVVIYFLYITRLFKRINFQFCICIIIYRKDESRESFFLLRYEIKRTPDMGCSHPFSLNLVGGGIIFNYNTWKCLTIVQLYTNRCIMD